MSLTKVSYSMIQGSPVNLLDFGADPTGTNDCSAALTAAIAASNNIYVPEGTYKFTNTVTVTGVRGLTIQGAGSSLLSSGTGYTKNTTFDFSSAPSGSNGLVFTDFVGLTLKNFTIRQLRSSAGGGKALYLYAGHDYSLDHVDVDLDVGTSGYGIVLGNGDGATATFVGNIKNCKVIGNGSPAIYANFGTSLTFESCYCISGSMVLNGLVYSSVISCAVDNSPSFGYVIQGSMCMVFDACGAESCNKGAFYLSTTSTNIIINAPYGALNNTSGDALTGDLVQLDSSAGVVENITINNPTALLPNASTPANIFGTVNTGRVDVINTNSATLALGLGGNANWIANKVTITGDLSNRTWTPALVGWTNVGSPTFSATYVKSGNAVTFTVTVTPATSISAVKGTSKITGLPFSSVLSGAAMMVDGNANSYGNCAVDTNGVIYMQTSGVLTVPITLVGTLILN